MKIGGFGFGLPHAYFESNGWIVEDVTLFTPSNRSPASDFIEPFMDPFVASFLHHLANGDLNHFTKIIVMRESPGAIFALHYGKELARKGVLPDAAPELVVLNLISAEDPAVTSYNLAEIQGFHDRLGLAATSHFMGGSFCQSKNLEALKGAQERAEISGAAAFEKRQSIDHFDVADGPRPSHAAPSETRRFALLGAPFGNSKLHQIIDELGHLVMDQQGWDQTLAACGGTAEAAFSAASNNPFSARHPDNIFVSAVLSELNKLAISDVLWQVDPHDDLWGWLLPSVRDAVENAGLRFHNLGFLPRWPATSDLTGIAERLTNDRSL